MKYLVTGAPGWLGNSFLEVLLGNVPGLKGLIQEKQADEIRCLIHPAFNLDDFQKKYPTLRPIVGDITQKDSLAAFFRKAQGGVLFHLAGLVHAQKFVREFYTVNFEGTRNVLEEAVKNGLKRIVVISSNSPAGNNPHKDHLFTEDTPYHPYRSYGRSKMLMEKSIMEASAKRRIETVILRPCWFYGPGQPARQDLFFTMIKNGMAPIVGDGESKRSMSYIENVCQALLLAANSEKATGQIYWITDKRPYSMNEIVGTVEHLLEKEFGFQVAHKRLRLPFITGEIATAVDACLQALGIYHQKIHVLSEMNKTIAASSAKAEKELQYRPVVDLEEGMRRSIRWCLDHGRKI